MSPRNTHQDSTTLKERIINDGVGEVNTPTPLSLPPSEMLPCGRHHKNGRNLIVCIDGTSNEFGDKNTNVIELYNLILKETSDNQRTYYNSGIGTYAQPVQKSFFSKLFDKLFWYHLIDQAIALDFNKTVQSAYRWLSDNYMDGDCIFLFGFSRGAYQVRVLSAMIDTVGLLYKGNVAQIPFAYALYRGSENSKPRGPATKVGTQQEVSMSERFKLAFSRKNVDVHFVGAWDTVSSVGIVRDEGMLPGTVDGMGHVCYFRHALALDERRVKFLPEFAHGGTSLDPKIKPNEASPTPCSSPIQKEKTPMTDTPTEADKPSSPKRLKRAPPHTLEVWFAGTHSDIGGGNTFNKSLDRNRPPLRWMVFEAEEAGLRTAKFQFELEPDKQIQIKESLTKRWWPLELLPLKRMSLSRREGRLGKITRTPHRGTGRKIHQGQKIHSSLLLAKGTVASTYTPKALPPLGEDSGNFWQKLREGDKFRSPWLELDLYDDAETALDIAISDPKSDAFSNILKTNEGRQAVYEKILEALTSDALPIDEKSTLIDVKHQYMQIALRLFVKDSLRDPSLSLVSTNQIYKNALNVLQHSQDYRTTASIFLEILTDSCIHVLESHSRSVSSVAFSPSGNHIASGAFDNTIRLWDANTGMQVGKALRGHIDKVRSVTFSPDGKLIASGSDDCTIRIWNAETGEAVGKPLRGHTEWVRSVAFSPIPTTDGTLIVSGSDDQTVRIWNVETGNAVGEPLRGHTGTVSSVVFSPDGKLIASGSWDKTIRLWTTATTSPLGEPLRAHELAVSSIVFSSDGHRLTSSSWDRSIRHWDIRKREQIGLPLEGHENEVNGVAMLPSGKRVVSCSDDETIRVWDIETGKQVGEPLRGHTGWVWSVAVSSDGKRLVTGSLDETVRTWDLETWSLVANAEVLETLEE